MEACPGRFGRAFSIPLHTTTLSSPFSSTWTGGRKNASDASEPWASTGTPVQNWGFVDGPISGKALASAPSALGDVRTGRAVGRFHQEASHPNTQTRRTSCFHGAKRTRVHASGAGGDVDSPDDLRTSACFFFRAAELRAIDPMITIKSGAVTLTPGFTNISTIRQIMITTREYRRTLIGVIFIAWLFVSYRHFHWRERSMGCSTQVLVLSANAIGLRAWEFFEVARQRAS